VPHLLAERARCEAARSSGICPRSISRRSYCARYLEATISRSSMSNTNVAPGLIRGGRPLSR
jgi:hypothetical protein